MIDKLLGETRGSAVMSEMKEELHPKFDLVPVSDDPVWCKLFDEHETECARKGAVFGNCGWSSSDTGICSKTSNGYLTSVIDPDTLKVTNTWEPSPPTCSTCGQVIDPLFQPLFQEALRRE